MYLYRFSLKLIVTELLARNGVVTNEYFVFDCVYLCFLYDL